MGMSRRSSVRVAVRASTDSKCGACRHCCHRGATSPGVLLRFRLDRLEATLETLEEGGIAEGSLGPGHVWCPHRAVSWADRRKGGSLTTSMTPVLARLSAHDWRAGLGTWRSSTSIWSRTGRTRGEHWTATLQKSGCHCCPPHSQGRSRHTVRIMPQVCHPPRAAW
jgi:hypothetical protein